MANAALRGKPDAENPHVRFDEGEVASTATPRRGSLLYKLCFALACCVCAVACASHAQTYSYAVASENLMTADELYPSKSSSKVAFSGIDLSQWRVAGGALRGAYCVSSNPNGLQAYAYHEYRTNGIYDVQLQGQDAGNIKGVKVRLWQGVKRSCRC